MPPDSQFTSLERRSSADAVFEQLAAAILRGDFAAGSALPSERELSERFEVSRVILRQATHRLADMGLVRVRQGGATLVLDPSETNDIRVIGLIYTLDVGADARQGFERDVIEKQFLQGLSLTSIVERRATTADHEALHALAQGFDEHSGGDAEFRAFEREFWSLAARAGGNRILKMEVSWWYDKLASAPHEPRTSSAPMAQRIAFYRELGRRLVAKDGASTYYLQIVSPILELLFAEPGEGETA